MLLLSSCYRRAPWSMVVLSNLSCLPHGRVPIHTPLICFGSPCSPFSHQGIPHGRGPQMPHQRSHPIPCAGRQTQTTAPREVLGSYALNDQFPLASKTKFPGLIISQTWTWPGLVCSTFHFGAWIFARNDIKLHYLKKKKLERTTGENKTEFWLQPHL